MRLVKLQEWPVMAGNDGFALAFHRPCGNTIEGATLLDLVEAVELHLCPVGARRRPPRSLDGVRVTCTIRDDPAHYGEHTLVSGVCVHPLKQAPEGP